VSPSRRRPHPHAPGSAGGPHLYAVPAGTPPARCRSCAAVVYFLTMPRTGSLNPIDCAPPTGKPPTATEPGYGASHFAACPDAARWRKQERKQERRGGARADEELFPRGENA
jgi:hypothetical protein